MARVDPMKGVVNPESLTTMIKALKAGDPAAKSYIRGSLQVLERRPPNKHIVPILRKALEKYS
jgi:hypothetical protein